MYADEINGYSIIASAIIDSGRGLILGESYRDSGSSDLRKVFVVSFAPHPDESPDYWHNGRYFDGPDSAQNETEARRVFAELLSDAWAHDTARKAQQRREAAERFRTH